MDARPAQLENGPLLRDLLEWIAAAPRSYQEVMQAWRSTCPRLTIWEDACDLRFVRVEREPGRPNLRVTITIEGRAFLDAN